MASTFQVPWGPIGYITFKKSYARRIKPDDQDSKTEEFWQVVKRELEASDKQLKVGFTDPEKERYYETRMKLKWSVAGRFMWQLGSKTVDKIGLPSLQNCAAVVINEPIRPFTWAFEMLMLGSGVGYNIQKQNVYQLPKLKGKIKVERLDSEDADFIVPDTREGWIKLLGKVLKAHFYAGEGFTYSSQLIRSKGAPIKGFGGTSSGPEELCWGINEIHKILNSRSSKKLRPIDCLDIMNIIGFIVVSGNVRRSAQLALGDHDDLEFLKAKRWDLGSIPNWRAMSNNSVVSPENLDDLPVEFWQTYENGEPYGLINLELSRECGRTGEIEYPDPYCEVFNPCVTGDTEILTKEGYCRIDKLVDQSVEVWNGFQWSTVTPKITGADQHLLKITLSDGRSLICTDYHKWHISTSYSGNFKIVPTTELRIGDKTIKHSFPVIEKGESVDLDQAYTQGFISAEGMDEYKSFWVYETKYECIKRLKGRASKSEFANFNGICRVQYYQGFESENKDFVPFGWDIKAKLSWLAGFLDGDGTELKEGGSQVVSTNLQFLQDIQKMLSTLGVDCKIVDANEPGIRSLPDGKGGVKDYYCNKTWRICIGAVGIQDLRKLGLKCERLKFEKSPNRDASQFARIISIEDFGYAEEVYCFDEPINHTGIFNGIITGQCAEQSLNNYETCCLATIFLPNIESYEELKEVLTFAYRMNKHSLAMKCSLKETEKIVNSNMRMGIGMAGYLQATEEQRSWLSEAYKWLRGYDRWYSGEKGFPRSIKLTTEKPDGTQALLPGVTPGAHPSPAGPYYIRRMRIASDSPLIEVCRNHGYHIEYQKNFDGTDDRNTMVVSFPCKVPEGTPVASDFSWKKQLDTVRRIQREWSDNSVSCTVYYKKEDLPEIKKYLKKHFRKEIKTISFLLEVGHGFDQAPYETITKKVYEEMISKTRPINNVSVKETDFELDVECLQGSCPIK